MPLAADMLGIGVPVEEGIRIGDTVQVLSSITSVSTASPMTTIANPNGATILELNASVSTSVASLIFHASTDLDRPYTLYNVGSAAVLIFPPASANFNGSSAHRLP